VSREALVRLRAELDRHVVAHDEAKSVLILGLVCREHVYFEGPPGSAKTRLAEVAAAAAGLPFFFYQLHRDTRLSEMVGDVVLERRPLEGGGGERIHQRVEPGGILTAELAVLDDISRAPGEALNVLLRILNERKFGDASIPLRTAIATSNPLRDEYYNEPLDPANLDRFALQLRVEGLIGSGDRVAARSLVDRYASGAVAEHPQVATVCSRAELDALYEGLARVAVPDAVKEALLDVFQRLAIEYGCNETNALLTDRSFLVKAVKLLRGRALLDGRESVDLADLDVLRWMTTYRVPPEVHEKVPELVSRVIDAARSPGEGRA
jgi:MoxR-like ATPase